MRRPGRVIDTALWLLGRYAGRSRRPGPLWSSTAEFDAGWSARIERMARFIDRPGTVADFGCGPMWLERYLPAGTTYLPVDYIRRDARTVVVDLNRDPIPPLQAQIGFLSGVLEYVYDVDAVIRQLEGQAFTRLIVSYNTLDRVPRKLVRRAVNWVSHEHLDTLLGFFCRAFCLVHVETHGTNTIMVFDRKAGPPAVLSHA